MPNKDKEKQKISAHKHYLRNKEAMKKRAAIWSKRHRIIIREYIKKFKENKPCCDCGKHYPHYVMDFDHTKGKKSFEIGIAYRGCYSLKKIKKEMEKCDLVCSNCHRIRTFKKTAG